MTLTKAQRETLEACEDWSAPFEVAQRRRALGSNVFARRVEGMLQFLHRRELVRFGAANNTYRITDAGRRAITQTQKDRK